MVNSPTINRINNAIASVESSNNYTTINNKTKDGKLKPADQWAIGKYGHYYKYNKDNIKQSLQDIGINVTNKSDEEIANLYANNAQAQEVVQNKLTSKNVTIAGKLIDQFKINASVEEITDLVHFLGPKGAEQYISLFKQYGQAKADEIMAYGDSNHPYVRPIGGPDSTVPNPFVSSRIFNFKEKLKTIPAETPSNQPKTNYRPQVLAPKPQLNPNPTFTASPYATPQTVQNQPKVKEPVDSRFKVVPDVLPKIERQPEKKPVKVEKERPWFTLPKVDVNWKTTASVGEWIYTAFGGNDEDKLNVFRYLENGGTLSDAWDIYENYKAKKGGSENSDLIGESKSIFNSENDANRIITNWGSKSLNVNKESKIKSNDIIPKLKVSDTPSVDKDIYTSKSFVANLKNSNNKFTILNNIHGGSGITDLNNYYNNFKPVNGAIVFTIQNDVVSGQKPLTTISKSDKWYNDDDFLIKLDGNNIKVTKGSSLKEGDTVFKLKNKIFSFEDFDIKDGKINTVFDNNINALIPVVKKDAKTYKSGNSFVIGLTDKSKSSGYLPIEQASQYGKSRGGSFIVFNEDMSQQYMVGGSFKNLYDFYQDLKKQYPNDTFKIFASDTGSYSNSFFPKSGQIDGDVYRKSNNRNTWGEVQHIVLMDN